MKPIKITTDSAEIAAFLLAVNGRATAHTYITAAHMVECATHAEARLEALGIPKALRAGAESIQQSGDKLPNAYKYCATTTVVTLRRHSAGWYLVAAVRSDLWPRHRPMSVLRLTSEQDAHAVRVLRRRYFVQEEVALSPIPAAEQPAAA